ncbi:MAG TPA: ribonuclease P protein component [Candidatus Polarisedimenticolaceae bacterium]|nr:ribonuclease P protein component [Candidatus Polarisedimenticolaceae bacterium]
MSYPGAARRGVSVSRSDGGEDRTFSRASRLRSRRLFLDIYRRGFRVSGKHVVVFALPGATGQSRLGITATKKLGHAADRNRVKRIIRETFRHRREAAGGPLDLVVNVKPTARDQSHAQIAADLTDRLVELARRFPAS